MQMNRRFNLISRDKEFSSQFSVHFSINNVNVNKYVMQSRRDLVRSRLLLL